MVFSTILPTALHGILSLLGAQAFVPAMIRRPVAALQRDAPGTPWKSAVAPLAVGTLWLIPFLALGTIGWLFWRVAGRVIEWFGWKYFTVLRDLALWIGAF
jgi:cytochrome b561